MKEKSRAALEYEMIPAQSVGDKFRMGWRPLSPLIAMVPPEFIDMEALIETPPNE